MKSRFIAHIVFGLAQLAGCHRGAAGEAGASVEPADPDPEQVVLRDTAALSRSDLDGFVALYSPDAKVFGLPTDPHALVGPWWEHMAGPDKLRRHFAAKFAKGAQPRFDVTDTVALADLVVARVKITDPPRFDRPQYVMSVTRVRDGKILDLWHVARDDGSAPRVGKSPEAVLRELMAAGNRVDVEGWLALFSPDAKQWKRARELDQLANVPSVKAFDQASRRKAYEEAFAATPHGRADILDTLSVGDLVASRGTFTFPDRVIHTLTIYRVQDGLLQDIWDVEQVVAPRAAGGSISGPVPPPVPSVRSGG
jgi:hypothetical protein